MPAWDFKGLPPEGIAVLSLGGNLGDVEQAFKTALAELSRRGMDILKISSSYRTKPVGCEEGAADFLNAAAIGRWPGSAQDLLKACKELEAAAGRPSLHPKWQSRSLDIDIIAFGTQELRVEGLILPHPLATERAFVLEPLAEIAPDMRLPGKSSSVKEAFLALKG